MKDAYYNQYKEDIEHFKEHKRGIFLVFHILFTHTGNQNIQVLLSMPIFPFLSDKPGYSSIKAVSNPVNIGDTLSLTCSVSSQGEWIGAKER